METCPYCGEFAYLEVAQIYSRVVTYTYSRDRYVLTRCRVFTGSHIPWWHLAASRRPSQTAHELGPKDSLGAMQGIAASPPVSSAFCSNQPTPHRGLRTGPRGPARPSPNFRITYGAFNGTLYFRDRDRSDLATVCEAGTRTRSLQCGDCEHLSRCQDQRPNQASRLIESSSPISRDTPKGPAMNTILSYGMGVESSAIIWNMRVKD